MIMVWLGCNCMTLLVRAYGGGPWPFWWEFMVVLHGQDVIPWPFLVGAHGDTSWLGRNSTNVSWWCLII